MKDGSYLSVSIFIIHIFLIFGWTHPYRVRKCIPHAILRKEIGFLEEQNLPWDFFPFLDQTCLASLRSADNSLIAESEKLSLGKFCSSSNPFLTMIAWRNIYSVLFSLLFLLYFHANYFFISHYHCSISVLFILFVFFFVTFVCFPMLFCSVSGVF